ncbi:hypothetical protein [Nocardia rosealba]|uniref:hypothetical protein n=1 Tax=Nocardia rosealba TaxID=2878563 RepID=UPI001CD9A77B|nr:hypothetical protein [Nocardia rosealba]MCA2210183.1 hypothetical protein [Nocardia rosealba]
MTSGGDRLDERTTEPDHDESTESVPAEPNPVPAEPDSELARVDTSAEDEPAEDEPDVGFTMADDEPEPEDPAERARKIMHQVARDLASLAPPDWQRLHAAFALTVLEHSSIALFSGDTIEPVQVTPPQEIIDLVWEHRLLSAELGDGPWWRLVLSLSRAGEIDVDYDYGDEPFPDEHLLAQDSYRADLAAFPRRSVPVWLSAYVGHDDKQIRAPRAAAEQELADRRKGLCASDSDVGLPPLPLMVARWAVLSAAFVAVGSEFGPRSLPSLNWFEGVRRSGSSLYLLPGNRAVLSGGVWNSPELAAAYAEGGPPTGLYTGAPSWISAQVLNHRAAGGMLSFCYWWANGRWYHGDSPTADGIAEAVPGFWSSETVARIVTDLLGVRADEHQRAGVETLVAAAEAGVVTRDTVVEVFSDAELFDVDAAFFQLTMAGVTARLPEPMPREDAIDVVRAHLTETSADPVLYPPDELHAERISVGWMVFVPVQPGEIAVGRAIFYVADDGVLHRSSSAVAPEVFAVEFAENFYERHRSVVSS